MDYTRTEEIEGREVVFRRELNFAQWEALPEQETLMVIVDKGVDDEVTVEEQVAEARRRKRIHVYKNEDYNVELLTAYLISFEVESKSGELNMRSATKKRVQDMPLVMAFKALSIARELYAAQKEQLEEIEKGNPTATS